MIIIVLVLIAIAILMVVGKKQSTDTTQPTETPQQPPQDSSDSIPDTTPTDTTPSDTNTVPSNYRPPDFRIERTYNRLYTELNRRWLIGNVSSHEFTEIMNMIFYIGRRSNTAYPLYAIVCHESKFNPNALNITPAEHSVGLTQINILGDASAGKYSTFTTALRSYVRNRLDLLFPDFHRLLLDTVGSVSRVFRLIMEEAIAVDRNLAQKQITEWADNVEKKTRAGERTILFDPFINLVFGNMIICRILWYRDLLPSDVHMIAYFYNRGAEAPPGEFSAWASGPIGTKYLNDVRTALTCYELYGFQG